MPFQSLYKNIYNSRQKSLGHLQKYDEKPYSSLGLHPSILHVSQLPLEQYAFVYETLDVVVHVKFFNLGGSES